MNAVAAGDEGSLYGLLRSVGPPQARRAVEIARSSFDNINRVLNETFANGAFRIERKDERDVVACTFRKRCQPNLFSQKNEGLTPEGKK